jgi:multiple antibiotic resistance protein
MWQERLSEFVTLFIVVNPLGTLPVLIALSAGAPAATQRKIALVATLVSFAVLVFFMLAGSFLLEKMGISLRSFQIAGGIILFLVALEMVRGGAPAASLDTQKDGAMAVAIYPLAIPKIAGPASMLTIVLLTDDHRFNIVQLAMTTGVLAAVLLITLGVMLCAAPISRAIGQSGASVVARVMGMILVALAVHTVLSALGTWLNLPKP